jgi:enoyl-CoA hydratase
MRVQLEDRILICTLDNPARGNAFSLADADVLLKSLKKYERSDDVDGLLLVAVGRVFCSGGNLSDYGKMKTAAQGKAVNRKITAALNALDAWAKPTACVVSGDCFGGGVELIAAFDFVVAVPEALLGLWQRRIALSFGWGGGARLERRVGPQMLRRLALEARTFSAHEARELGIVDEVVVLTQSCARAEEWLHAQARLPKAPLASLKNFIARAEQKIFEKLWWNPEHRGVLWKHNARSKKDIKL